MMTAVCFQSSLALRISSNEFSSNVFLIFTNEFYAMFLFSNVFESLSGRFIYISMLEPYLPTVLPNTTSRFMEIFFFICVLRARFL